MPTTYPIRPLAAPAPGGKRPKANAAPKPKPQPRLSTREGKGGDGQACVNNIVANDQQTHVFITQALYYRNRMLQAGRPDNPALSAQLDKVVATYSDRQQRLRTSKLLKTSTGLTQWAKSWTDKLKAMVSGPGIGVLPLVPIALAVLAGVGLSIAVWYAFHQDEPKSAADVIAAFHASEAYNTMSPDQQTASDQAMQQAGKGGYQEGKDASDNSFFGQLKTTAVWVGAGLLAASLLKKKGG